MVSILFSRVIEESIPDKDNLMDYLHCVRKHGSVIASSRLERSVGEAKKIEIEWYAFNEGYTYRSPDGRIRLNVLKELAC